MSTNSEEYYQFLGNKLSRNGVKIFELSRGNSDRARLPQVCEEVTAALIGMVQLSLEKDAPLLVDKRDLADAKFGLRLGDLSDLILGVQTAIDYRHVSRIGNYPLKLLLMYAENRTIEQQVAELGNGRINHATAWKCIGNGLNQSVALISEYLKDKQIEEPELALELGL